jgi:hypothetical protein
MRPRVVAGAAIASGLGLGYVLVVTGAATVDLGMGRRVRRLGPQRMRVAASPETVFDVIAGPYLGKTPHAMAARLNVLERGHDMVLAEHFTPVALGLRATTLETVRFERPHRVSFRLVRGPVPYVTETYELRATPEGTDFAYQGELGTDLWRAGELWGRLVARSWERAVTHSLEGITAEAERRAATATRPRASLPVAPDQGATPGASG